MKKVTLALFLAVLFYAAAATAQMGQGMMGGKGSGMKPMGTMGCGGMGCQGVDLMKTLHQWGNCLFTQKDQLGLTDPQIDQIQSIQNSHMKDAIKKNADRRVLLIEIQELLLKDKVNLSEVEAKIKALEALNTDLSMQGVQTLEEALTVLTPEQQKKAKTLFKTSACMRAMRMGEMQGGMMMGPEGMMGGQMMKGMAGHGGSEMEKKTP